MLEQPYKAKNANWNAVSRRRINGSFLADLLPVTRDRLALLATEIGDTSKAPPLPEAVAERQELARTMAQAPWLRGSGGGFSRPVAEAPGAAPCDRLGRFLKLGLGRVLRGRRV